MQTQTILELVRSLYAGSDSPLLQKPRILA